MQSVNSSTGSGARVSGSAVGGGSRVAHRVWKEGFCKFLIINNHGYRSEKVSQDITSDGERLRSPMQIIVQSQETADQLRRLAEGD